jgi:hypothetical protein
LNRCYFSNPVSNLATCLSSLSFSLRRCHARWSGNSSPPLLKAWQDAVLTRMFYFAYEAEGRGLEGTPLMIAITAGNTGEVYRSGGRNMFSMSDLLSPLRATALARRDRERNC